MSHDFTKPGMSEATAKAIRALTLEREFRSRVAHNSRKVLRHLECGGLAKGNPCRSTTNKALAYYDGDAGSARFVLKPGANDAAMVLQRLGASVEFAS